MSSHQTTRAQNYTTQSFLLGKLKLRYFTSNRWTMQQFGTASFHPCDTLECHVGFMLFESECVCDKRLQKYTISCNISDLTITHTDADCWVGLDRDSDGLILHPHCPFDCRRSGSLISQLYNSGLQWTTTDLDYLWWLSVWTQPSLWEFSMSAVFKCVSVTLNCFCHS